MEKVITLSKDTYYIVDKEDSIEEVLTLMSSKDYLGSNEAINHKELILDNTCFRLEKEIQVNDTRLTFKKAKIRDAKEIARYMNKGMINVPNTIEYKKRFVEILINGEYNEFLWIYDERTLIGLAEICLEEDIPEITTILVFERYRGQGYGKQILYLVEKYLANEYDTVTIVVSDLNTIAYHLYNNNGYKMKEPVMYYYRKC